MAQTSDPARAAIREVDRPVGAERDSLVQGAHRRLRAHRHGDDLLDRGLATLADLHRGLDPVGVEWVQVLLARAVEPLGPRVDPLLNSGVRNLLDETADLQSSSSLGLVSLASGGGS